MEIIGIIGEYNPFHNGHIYHINKIKELYPNSIIILVLNSYFLERGQISIESIKTKTILALKYNVDIVIELPFIFGTNSADIFAASSIELLNYMGINKLIFGSESNNIDKLTSIAKKQLNTDYINDLKKNLNKGLNYPTALNLSLNSNISTPNDLLAISYIKCILENNYNIDPISIKRTNSYHDIKSNNSIISATNIREKLKNNLSISNYAPNSTSINSINYDLYFKLLKYKIITEDNLSKYLTVDEGIENRLKNIINDCNSIEDLINKTKSKRYTYNRINRMLIHILIGLTKSDKEKIIHNEYIRLLGFSNNGKNYINTIKNNIKIPIITKTTNLNSTIYNYSKKAFLIYNLLTEEDVLSFEYSNKPIKNI